MSNIIEWIISIILAFVASCAPAPIEPVEAPPVEHETQIGSALFCERLEDETTHCCETFEDGTESCWHEN